MTEQSVWSRSCWRARQLHETLRKPYLGGNAATRQQLVDEIGALTGRLRQYQCCDDEALMRTCREMIRDRRELYRQLCHPDTPPRWRD